MRRVYLFVLPAVLCPLALYCSSTARPYSVDASVALGLTWISGISLLVATSIWMFPFDPLDRDDGQDEDAVCSYVWRDGGERLSVCVNNEYGDIKDFDGRLSVKAYDKAVGVINQGAPRARPREQAYMTEVCLRNGNVVEVRDGFYNLAAWQSAQDKSQASLDLFSQFTNEFNGPPIVWRKRQR